VLGKTVKEVVGEKVYEEALIEIDRALSGIVTEFEHSVDKGDGETRWLNENFLPHHGPDDQPLGYFSVAKDITSQKLANEKTANLEKGLQQASKLEAVGQLASGIAHEINTPTQYISDNLQFITEGVGDLQEVLKAYAKLKDAACTRGGLEEEVADVETAEETADLGYLLEEIPSAAA